MLKWFFSPALESSNYMLSYLLSTNYLLLVTVALDLHGFAQILRPFCLIESA